VEKMTPKDLEALFKRISRFDQTLGLELSITEAGDTVYKMKVDERHASSPISCHGGAIAGMMDAVLGVRALAYSVTQMKFCSTVEFKINFLNPAVPGDLLIGASSIDFVGKRLVVTSATISAGEKLVAKGIGTFNLYPISKFGSGADANDIQKTLEGFFKGDSV
jgi:uncharacterized protein (TIGR00369 family)